MGKHWTETSIVCWGKIDLKRSLLEKKRPFAKVSLEFSPANIPNKNPSFECFISKYAPGTTLLQLIESCVR